MDPILRYVILSSCVLLIGMIPFFVIRIYMYTIKTHFILAKTAQRMSLVTNLLSFILFLGLLIFYTSVSGFLSVTFYVVMVLTFVLVLLIHKYLDMRPLHHAYIISFTRFNSRLNMIKSLTSNQLTHISSKSTFSLLTHIKFVSLTEEETSELKAEIKGIGQLFVPFTGVFAHVLFALYVVILSVSFVSFIVFFNVLI